MSEPKFTGGPAFPHDGTAEKFPEQASPGMTLRDWFATHCPDGEIPSFVVRDAMDAFGVKSSSGVTPNHFQALRVSARYAYADAMIAARSK